MSADQAAPDRRASGRRDGSLLDRPIPEGYREAWTERFAQRPEAEAGGDEQARAVLVFRIGEEWLALPTAILEEVAEPRRPHPLPHRRDGLVLGVVNVRGELLVCVTLAGMLGLEAAEEPGAGRSAFARMLVIGREGRRAAFQVDEVQGVLRYGDRDLLPAPATIAKAAALTVGMVAWGERTIGLLGEDRLLDALDRSIG